MRYPLNLPMLHHRGSLKLLVTLVSASMLAACSGGGSNSPSPKSSSSSVMPASSSSNPMSSADASSSLGISSSLSSSSSLLSSEASSQESSSSQTPSSSAGQSSSVAYSAPENDIAVNGDVESGTLNWLARGDAGIAQSTHEQYAGAASLFVSDRMASWQGATFSVGNLTAGNDYEVAVWVKLAADEPDTIVKITGKNQDDADPETYLEYTTVAAETVSANEWTLLLGNYVPSGATPFEAFILETEDGSENVSFYADNFSVAGDVEPEQPIEPPPAGSALKDLADIDVGVAVATFGTGNLFNSQGRQTLVKSNFDLIVAENIMKMSYMYSSGTNFSFTEADQLVNWALNNGVKVHGHALVWHHDHQLPDWARNPDNDFKDTYRNHVSTVADHYKDKVIGWDVVNEALHDENDNAVGLPSANGYRQSVFYQQFNGPEYIDEAFRLARQADPDAELYYNDFNTENGQGKTDALVSLVQRLLDNDVPIDGVGFQMHVVTDWPSISVIRQSLQRIVNLDPNLKVKITELDVRVNNVYDNNANNDVLDCTDTSALARQKARYKEIIKAYYDVVPAAQRGGISVWGIADPDSWFKELTRPSDNAKIPGCPLLFDDSLQPKPAYEGFKEALNESV